MCFFIVPAIFMAVSLAGDAATIVLACICVLIALFITIVNVLQTRRPQYLPEKLRTWAWLPEPMRSLRPYDVHIFGPLGRLCKCGTCEGKMFKYVNKPEETTGVQEMKPSNGSSSKLADLPA